jgi:hypothetical protein
VNRKRKKDGNVIEVNLDLPQYDWPDPNNPAKKAMMRAIDMWLGEFYEEHKRFPNSVELAEAAYVLGRAAGREAK